MRPNGGGVDTTDDTRMCTQVENKMTIIAGEIGRRDSEDAGATLRPLKSQHDSAVAGNVVRREILGGVDLRNTIVGRLVDAHEALEIYVVIGAVEVNHSARRSSLRLRGVTTEPPPIDQAV